MTDLLLNLTIGPLQFIYEIVYSGLFGLTHNYGWSLILLSFVTTFITVPLGQAVSVHIKKERLIESILDPQIKKIKSTSTGAEQSRRIRNLYKRYAYNPLYSIRLAFGVLIQLPFLIGAYWMIAEHPSLNGVSFGPIADLSKPDQLLWGINLLPLIMTIANLGVVAISLQMPKRDRIQAVIVASLFLILLYSAPSALLVYWTTNNLLLLVRTIFYHKKSLSYNTYSKSDLKKIKPYLTGILAYFLAVAGSILIALNSSLTIFQFEIIKGTTDVIFILLAFGILIRFSRFNSKADVYISLSCIALVFFLILRVGGYWIYDLSRYKLTTQFMILIPLMLLVMRFKLIVSIVIQKIGKLDISNLCLAFWPTALFISVLIFIYLPIDIYCSDPHSFTQAKSEIIRNLFVTFEAVILILLLLKILIKKNWLINLSSFAFFCLAITAFVYTFIVPSDYGVLNSFILSEPNKLYSKMNKYWDVLILFAIFIFVTFIIWKNKITLVAWSFTFITAALVVNSIFSLYNINSNQNKKFIQTPQEVLPKNVENFLTFSQNKQNIIVIMLDMFTGGNMKEILSSHPELKKEFDGFTWFEDSVSAGPVTIFGKPGILGGKNVTPLPLNIDKSKSLEEKINFGWSNFLGVLQRNNFHISLYDHTWLKPTLIQQALEKPGNFIDSWLMWDGFPKNWAQENNINVYTSVLPEQTLRTIALFRVSPLSLKKKIYGKGRWCNTVNLQQTNLRWALNNISHLDALSDSSTIEHTQYNTFKFVINEITHLPWSLDATCKPTAKGPNNEGVRLKNGTFESHLQVEYCSLKSISKFLKWLKRNQSYQNTMIILVSDHGRGDSSQIYKLWGKPYPYYVHSLLMIKPFNKNGILEVDSKSLTANWDVPQFIMNELKITNQQPWLNNNRVRNHVYGEWQRTRHPKNYFELNGYIEIKGSLFNLDNWKERSIN